MTAGLPEFLNLGGGALQVSEKIVIEELDQEWIELMEEARRLEIPIDEIRQFLMQK